MLAKGEKRVKRDWGTTAVLLADMAAALAVITWGILYAKFDLIYLLPLYGITLGLALLVGLLLRQSGRRQRSSSPRDAT